MHYRNLQDFIDNGKLGLKKSPVALIFVEDDVEVESTIHHHAKLGFREVVVFAREDQAVPECPDVPDVPISKVTHDFSKPRLAFDAINTLIKAAPKVWFYYCYNAEYLYFPFSDTRSVGDMLAFSMEERRPSILTYVIDLYATDLYQNPSGVSLEDACMDRSGYYALARKDEWGNDLDRQMDFFGGLRWRFEEHIPVQKRKIDRIALFQANPAITILDNHTFTDPEYNTYSCPWHNSMTAAIMSFRVAKALKRNPLSREKIQKFTWHNSIHFEWSSEQLLQLGIIEPGQWF